MERAPAGPLREPPRRKSAGPAWPKCPARPCAPAIWSTWTTSLRTRANPAAHGWPPRAPKPSSCRPPCRTSNPHRKNGVQTQERSAAAGSPYPARTARRHRHRPAWAALGPTAQQRRRSASGGAAVRGGRARDNRRDWRGPSRGPIRGLRGGAGTGRRIRRRW